jgi:hypothetical protein
LHPNISAIILAVVQFVATLSTTFIIDKGGRRVLLLSSCLTVVICMMALETYYYLKEIDQAYVADLQWLPLTSLSIFIFSFSIGLGPIPWVIMSEVFSYDVKAFMTAFTGVVSESTSFVIISTFDMLVTGIGIGPTFWLFAGLTMVGLIFIFFLVPETKGKSFLEIQEILSGHAWIVNKIW